MTQPWVALMLVAAAPLAPDRSTPAPVTAVTVYSDRARVTRTATVVVSGRQRVELPLLGADVDAGSVRLESADAEVQTVDLKWVAGDEA